MPKWGKILLCTAFSFMFMFISVGYARLTDTLSITGRAEIKEPEMVYITKVEVNTDKSVLIEGSNPKVEKTGVLVFQHHNYSLEAQTYSGYQTIAGGKIEISVTVRNNSGKPQYFSELITTSLVDGTNPLDFCAVKCDRTGEALKVDNKGTKTYTFTIQNTSNKAVEIISLESILKFTPQLDYKDTETATKALVKSFAHILAGDFPNGNAADTHITFRGQDYPADQILDLLLKSKNNGGAMNGVDTGGYMGNVDGAEDFQKELVEQMFGEHIVIEIGDNAYSVSVLIKNQQMDTGENDMVIYITADQLFQGGGGWNWNANTYTDLNYVPVYALVYIHEKDDNGEDHYYYCDHLFEGEAPVCDYDGNFGEGETGNFNTNLWRSTESFKDMISDTSGGSISQQGVSTNGELDEAYQYYRDHINSSLTHVDSVIASNGTSNSGNS